MNTKGMKFLAVLAVLAMAFAVFAVALPANDADDEVEVYVDAVNGSDDNKGTQESPVKTVEKALELIGTKTGMIVLLSDYTADEDFIEFSQLTIDLNGNKLTVLNKAVAIAEKNVVTITDSAKTKGAMYIGKNGFGNVALHNMGKLIVDGANIYADLLHVAYASYQDDGTLGEIVATNTAFVYGDKDWEDEKSEWSVWIGDAENSYFALGAGTIATVLQTGPTSAFVIIEGVDEADQNEVAGPSAEVRGDFTTNGVNIGIGKDVTVTVYGEINMTNFKGESVTQVSHLVMGEGSSLITAIPNDPENVPAIIMEKETTITMANGAYFDGTILMPADETKVTAKFTAGEKGIKIIAGSITITGVMDATTANAILDEAEGTVILDDLTVIGGGNDLEINDGDVTIRGLALDGSDVVIAAEAAVVIDGTVASIGETESTIIAEADSISTTGRADIEVEVETGGTYPEYKDGDRVLKDGTMFTIGHAKASSGRIVQFGVALSILVYNGEDQKGEIKNATVTSFDNFYPWTSAGMPQAWIWPEAPETECRHAGYYNLEVYFGVTNNVTTTTINALMKDCALIEQAPSDVTLVEYEADQVYGANVIELGVYNIDGGDNYTYTMTGVVLYYNGDWAPGTWPADMSEGYYVVFQVEGLEEYVAEFPNAMINVADSGWKAFDGFLLKFIGTSMLDVEEFTVLEFLLDNDGTDGEFDDYKATLYTINMDLTAYGYDVTVKEIQDDFEGVPVEELVGEDFEINVVPANAGNDEEEYDAYVSGTLFWYDGIPLETDIESFKYGYFVPFQIVLPDTKTFDDVDYVQLLIPGAEPIVLQKKAKQILIPEGSRDYTLLIGMEGQDYVFHFDLTDVEYEPVADHVAEVAGYEGVIHGFADDYVDDMFYMVFADDFEGDLAEIYYLGMNPGSILPVNVYSQGYQATGFENIFWVAYNQLTEDTGDGFYQIIVKNTNTEDDASKIVMRGNGIAFVWNEISDLVMDCGENGENFSAVMSLEPDDDGVYHVDFTANKLYYIPQWIVDIVAQYGADLKAGYYLGFEIDFAGEILPEEATVIFPDATLENPIGYKVDTGLYFVYLGANKAFLQDRYVTIDADGDGELAPVDFKLCVCGADEEVAIGFAAAGIILKDTYVDDSGEEHYYDDIYLNCENGQYVKLPNGKDSTRNFVRWSIEATDYRAYNWDSIYIVSWWDDCSPKDGQIVFTADTM